jgi:hypothetical protein
MPELRRPAPQLGHVVRKQAADRRNNLDNEPVVHTGPPGSSTPARVTSAGVVYRRPLGDLVLRLCGEFGGQGRVVGF